MLFSIALSMRERPQTQLLLGDLPEPGQALRLDDQEEDDQYAEDDGLQVRHDGVRDLDAEELVDPARGEIEKDGEQRDEGGAEKRTEDRADEIGRASCR